MKFCNSLLQEALTGLNDGGDTDGKGWTGLSENGRILPSSEIKSVLAVVQLWSWHQ